MQTHNKNRLGRGENNEYYFSYNQKSLTFPRNIFHSPKLRATKALAKELPDESFVLDAGCGAGYVSVGLAPRLNLIGVDIEKEAIQFCQKNRKGKFLQANLSKLPFQDNTFELIIFTNTIEHLEYPEEVLKELRRVLKPGGKLLVSTENCSSLLWVILENTWYRFFGGPCKPFLKEVHPQRYTPKSLENQLEKFFKIVSFKKAIFDMELLVVGEKI
jgi:ubiquinone/menaquinone biosynthesis C-methylase UbiE